MTSPRQPRRPMQVFEGLGVTEGVAFGKAVCINTRLLDVLQIPIASDKIDAEIERFHAALSKVRDELHRMRDRVEEELGHDLAGIFDAQALLLTDPTFVGQVEEHIRGEAVNAEWAVHQAASSLQARFEALDVLHLRERGEDLRDVCRHLLRCLQGLQVHRLSEIAGDVVIVADDLTPSDAVRLGRENVRGFAIEHGSRTSHTTIIARSLNIPAVTGVGGLSHLLADHTEAPIIVDGLEGKVILHPTAELIERYRERQRDLLLKERHLLATRDLEAVTRDGVQVQVMANIDLPEEVEEAQRFGAAGIGLYRSEFLYIEMSPQLPSEEQHMEIYRRMVRAAAPHPAIIRTYDLGGRKIARELLHTQEDNPVLGLRGIRLTLAKQDVFRPQLRALFRAATEGELWIMLPMVTLVEEVRLFRKMAARVLRELECEGLPFRSDYKLGVMIEVPAAAMISDLLAREVDFFSLGTNDLIQYSLAVDRNNEQVADLYQPFHPGMIRLLKLVIDNAGRAGIEISLCGEMGGDPFATAVLLGCGLRRVSVSPRQVPIIKRRIRELDTRQLEQVVATCANLATAAEVEQHLRHAVSSEAEQSVEDG